MNYIDISELYREVKVSNQNESSTHKQTHTVYMLKACRAVCLATHLI